MKKILLSLFCLGFVCCSFAQNVEMNKGEALALVQKSSAELGFRQGQTNDLVVAQSYGNLSAGIEYIYLQQTYEGIPVHNRIMVLAYKNGKLISKAGEFFPVPPSSGNLPNPGVSASEAVKTAAAYVKAKAPGQPIALNGSSTEEINFGQMGIAYEDIKARQYWLPITKAGKTSLVRVWQVILAPENTDDMWQIRVDAQTNTALEKNNLTVYDQFDKPQQNKSGGVTNIVPSLLTQNTGVAAHPALVGTVNYLVIPYPVESPLYGPATLVTNPWTMTGAFNANATTLKWHNDGVVDYTISRGNNVWATEDRVASNANTGLPATSSTTPDPLNFNFPPDYTVAPTTPAFQQYAITNLFYWNNIMHDLSYNYTFDEVSGNFQANNLGRGGAGGDHVIGLAQSGAGTNNANFATPADGGRGRMRMYLFTATNPQRDGDVDAGVMCHEYTHGISSRLTGGIAGGAGCLGNAEEGGEGWSDYFALMATTNWSTAVATDGFTKKRPLGNYVEGQGVNGGGIRTHPYCTNFAVNPLTYAFVATSGGEVHDIGEVWAETLWDMTWNIIQTDGINPNLFNAAGAGGNARALRLVTEGLRLQPCSPGFIDGRDAILHADQLLYGGQYHCAILSAFAARGMGTDARQGSSSATNDQTVGFSTVESSLILTASLVQQQEGLQVTYTNHVTAGACGAISNYIIRDTLPTNVTYISGGTYTAATRVVSFTVNVPAGTTVDYPFTVQINAGAYFPTVSLFEDLVPGPTIPAATWSTSTTGASAWTVSAVRSHSPSSSYFCAGVTTISDARLFFTNSVALPATPPNLTFWHWYNTESTYDGGILEISTDGGANYTYVPAANFIKNGYTTAMDASTVLAGKTAWSGSSGGFIKTVVNLLPYANQSVKLRFRNTNDNGTTGEGWYVDDIAIKNQATVDIRSTLFNASNTILQVADTVTVILPPGACTPVAITTQPSNASGCAGTTVTFTGAASGSSPTYQWQVSTNGGTTYTDIPGATTATLTLNNVTVGMNGYLYHLVVSNSCPSTATSSAATLTVNASTLSITGQPSNATVCAGSNATFTVTATGTGITYQWQVSTDGGTTFTNIAGATGASYTVTGATAAMNNNQYHVVVSGTGACSAPVTSSNAVLTVQTAPAITTQPTAASTCAGTAVTFTSAATGTNITYQWQSSPTGCAGTFTNIAGATSATYTVASPTAAQSGTAYHVVVSGVCTPASVTSNCVLLTVNSPVSVTTQPTSVTACVGTNATFTVVAGGTAPAYQWQVSTDGGTTFTNIAGATAAGYTVTGVTAAMNNNQYHVVISNACPGTVTSNNVTLTVQSAPAITVQPVAFVTCTGATVSFCVTATGTNITYQWQSSATGCAGTFTNIPGATSNCLTFPAIVANNGFAYKVVVSGVCTPASVTSSCVLLTVNPTLTVNTQPANTTACAGASATFTAAATGGTVTYQWQVSTDGGQTFNNIAGATAASYTVNPVTAAMNNNQYRALLNSQCATNVASTAATLTVQSTPAITTQPQSITSCATTATFTVAATGTGIVYQWQVSTNNGATYTNIPGAASNTLNLTGLTPASSGNLYQVVVSTTSCGTVTSNAVFVHVGTTPSVVLTAAPTTVYNPSHNGGLFTTVSPVGNYSYHWTRDGVALSVNAPQITEANGLLYDFGTYVVTVTDVSTGCSGVSNSVTIVDDPNGRNQMFISPNPTTGPVQVSFYSATTATQTRGLTVYDSKGAEVMTKSFTTTGRYAAMNIDLTGKAAGIYMIILRDASGKRISGGEVIKF